ncbi:MAG TPA: glycosyltransferase family 4 protein [Solirubrobacterales bacterium]
MSAPRILHVLPHAGGGGETYVRELQAMSQFSFKRFELSRHRRPAEAIARLVPLARTIPKHDLVHIHGDSTALVCLPVIGVRPTVITLHGSHLLRRSRGLRGGAVRAGLRLAFHRADAVIAVSESERDEASRLAPGAAARIILIHNGVPEAKLPEDADRDGVRAELGLEQGSVAVLFLGELIHRKQPLQFADAVTRARAANPAIVGLVAGDGPLRGALERYGGEGIRLLGARDDADVLVGACDVFALPSRWEGLSYAVLEAMALGRAMLVSDGPGNPDAVADAGIVFPVGDSRAMADGLTRLAADPGLRDSLGQAAAARARERFSLTEMLRATAGLYEAALGKGGAA